MTTDANATTTNQTHQQLVGIRGWLILPALGLALGLILGVVGVVTGLGSLEKMVDRGYSAYSVPSLLVDISLLIYLCVTAVRFFKKRKDAPQTLIHFLIARIAASVVLFVLGIAVIGGDDELVLFSLLRSNNFIAQGIAAAIWIPYFRVSKRVKATFVY